MTRGGLDVEEIIGPRPPNHLSGPKRQAINWSIFLEDAGPINQPTNVNGPVDYLRFACHIFPIVAILPTISEGELKLGCVVIYV
jgi:hypothetical protein